MIDAREDLMSEDRLKIAFILPGRANSGGVRVMSTIAARLLDRGHAVRILYQRPSLANWCRLLRSKMLGAQDWLSQFPGEIARFGDIRECRFQEDEIIVGVGMAMSYQLGFLESVPNVRVQYLHGATPWDPELMRMALTLPLPKIVVASYLKEIVTNQGAGQVLAVVHNGVNPSEYFSSVPESERDGVGTIYSTHPAKDPGTVLSVIRKLRSVRPHVPLRIFGGERRPSQIGSSWYWRYPSVEQAREIYSRSLVWVLASWSEGFPAPVLEAMACGCAVVATDCGGSRDIITDGVDGFLVPVRDMDGILRRVGQLLDDPVLREKIRLANQQAVRRFTWVNCVLQLETALEAASCSCDQVTVGSSR